MVAQIETLIDKVDNVELIRDQIAAIILVEQARQQELAAAADPAKDPELWRLRVFLERANPWDEFPSDPQDGVAFDAAPLVNVWWANSDDGEHTSNVVERQRVTATFHIDCYGYGVSRETEAGHDSGDETAALEAQRAARLVRNILMSAHYTYLGMRGVVARRWRASAQSFQPAIDSRPVAHVSAVRQSFQVTFNEFSPQHVPVPLALISVAVKRIDTGELLFTADYPQEVDS
jgi:hypothetical protein